jgi:hypothetical protein
MPGAADWTVVLRGTGGSEVPASKLPPGSWLSPWRQMGPGEVAWDVDRYNLAHGEELAAVLGAEADGRRTAGAVATRAAAEHRTGRVVSLLAARGLPDFPSVSGSAYNCL